MMVIINSINLFKYKRSNRKFNFNVILRKTIFLLVISLLSHNAFASNTELALYARDNTISGKVTDGRTICNGILVTDIPHSGFMLQGERKTEKQGVYYIYAQHDLSKKIRVRLELSDGKHQAIKDNQLSILTTDNIVRFNVVTDGDQQISADIYPFTLSAKLIR